MRSIVHIGVAALAFWIQSAPRAADGGRGGSDHDKADGGAARAAVRPALPSALLRPSPPTTGSKGQREEGDAEQKYVLTTRANGTLFYQSPQFSAEVQRDGTVEFHDRRARYSAPKATLSFDLFDDFVQGFDHGALHRYEKASFLTATFARRTAMAAKWHLRQMRTAREELPSRLDALWADTRYRRRERRRIICLLWEEIDSPSASARAAATTIEKWVRERLPRGSADAYTDDELDACSRDDGHAPAFRPYGASLEDGNPSRSSGKVISPAR